MTVAITSDTLNVLLSGGLTMYKDNAAVLEPREQWEHR